MDPPSALESADARSGSFRGRILARIRVLDQGVAASPLPNGNVLVAGRHRNGWHCFEIRRTVHDPAGMKEAVACALASLREAGAEEPSDPTVDERMMIDLLRAAPHQDAALRAQLLPRVIPSPATSGHLARLLSDALGARPGNTLEFQALLRHFRSASDEAWAGGRDAEAGQLLRPVVGCLGEEKQAGDWRATPQLRAMLSAEITGFPLFHLAADGAPDAKKIRGWMEDLLLDEEPLVRLSTLQALAGTVAPISKVPDSSEREILRQRVFPARSGAPAVTGARWLVDLCAKVLKTWPPSTSEEHQTDCVTWTAIVAVTHLLYVYPDSALVILHHLAISGVTMDVFRIIQERVARYRRKNLQDKLALYVPRLSVNPTMAQVWAQASAVVESSLPEGPDGARQEAQKRIYEVLRRLATASTIGHIADEIDQADERLERQSDQTPWQQELLATDQPGVYYWRTRNWIKEHLQPLARRLRHPNEVDALAALTDWTDDKHASARKLEEDLVEPERTILRAIRQHWRTTISELLPATGQEAQNWGLGRCVWASKDNVIFDVKTAPDGMDPSGYRIAATTASNADQHRDLMKRWRQVEAASHKAPDVLPGHCVVPHGLQVWLVMRRVDGGIPSDWPAPKNRDDCMEHLCRARRLANDIALALRVLHQHGVRHGDVTRDNIFEDGQKFVLIDFGRVDWLHATHRDPRVTSAAAVVPRAVPKNLQTLLRHHGEAATDVGGDRGRLQDGGSFGARDAYGMDGVRGSGGALGQMDPESLAQENGFR